MADGGCTLSGLEEKRAGAARLPDAVTEALRQVAATTAARIHANAKARLISQLRTDRRALAEAITLRADVANREVIVESKAPRGQPANLPLWVEYGTVKMGARPYLGPAARAESATYSRACEAAALAPVRALLET